nr:MAG TPA: hypothetical protein [Caudoviricetes sp.]
MSRLSRLSRYNLPDEKSAIFYFFRRKKALRRRA